MLPTFIVIGGAKVGSTSLYHYLRAHPDVFMPEQKELEFFVGEKSWPRGVAWYEAQFDAARDASALGEASPRYTMRHRYAGVAERMAELIPDARLVYVVRHPVERMISHYQHELRTGKQRSAPAEALLGDDHYLNSSRYAFQLDEYTPHFPRDRIRIILSERLKHERQRVLDDTFAFIGVDPAAAPDRVAEEYNVTAVRRQPRRPVLAALKRPGIGTAVHVLPEPVKRAGRRVTHRPAVRPVVDKAIRRELEARLRDDVARLREEWLGPEFDGWGIA